MADDNISTLDKLVEALSDETSHSKRDLALLRTILTLIAIVSIMVVGSFISVLGFVLYFSLAANIITLMVVLQNLTFYLERK